MPALTRRRNRDALQETWLIYFGDVRVGAVSRSVGNPNAAPQWQWHCGFYPGSAPGECKSGTAASFEAARAAFEAAWRVFLSNRTRRIFRRGAINGIRPPRNIGASIAVSGCRVIGAPVADYDAGCHSRRAN
jgi:hypothetical protein